MFINEQTILNEHMLVLDITPALTELTAVCVHLRVFACM